MKTDDHLLLSIVDRARVELVYTRSSLGQFMHDNEEFINEIGNLRSRCSDAIREADELRAKIAARIDAERLKPV